MSMTRSMCSRPSMRSQARRVRAPPFRRAAAWPNKRVDDQRRFARARDAGHAGEQPERNLGVDVLQVVAARADDAQQPRRGRAAGAASGTAMRRRPERYWPVSEAGLRLDVARACPARPAARRARRRRDPGPRRGRRRRIASSSCSTTITVLPRSRSRSSVREQAPVVALVQADRGLIQDVHDAGEPGADLAGEADALRLRRPRASRRCDRASDTRARRRIRNRSRSHHALDDLGGDLAAPAGQAAGARGTRARRPTVRCATSGRLRSAMNTKRAARFRRVPSHSGQGLHAPGSAPAPRAPSATRSRGSGASGWAGCPRTDGACACGGRPRGS